MKVLAINGSARPGGFSSGSIDIIVSYLKINNIEAEIINLADADIKDCIGCFSCLKTGECVLKDDMQAIIEKMQIADGYVIASSVRVGLPTACYKRFYERITYTLGFPLHLEDKYTLAVSSVGFMGGKTINKKMLGLQTVVHSRLSGFLFFKTGIPASKKPKDFKRELEKGTSRLIENINKKKPRSISAKLNYHIDRFILPRFVFFKAPEMYENVIKCWKKKNYIK